MRVRLPLVLGAIYVASFSVFAIYARFPLPYRDDWDWLRAQLTVPLTLRSLFEPHNEHVIALPRLLYEIQVRFEGLDGYLLFVIALATPFVVSAVFWQHIRHRWTHDPDRRALTVGILLACVFSTYQLQSIVFVAAVLFPMVVTFAVIACGAAASASDPQTLYRRVWWTAALVAAIAAAITTTNGLLVPGLVLLVALASGVRRSMLLLFAALQLLCIVGYVLLAGEPWNRAPAPAEQRWAWTSFGTTLAFFLAFFSAGVTYAGSALGASAGTLWLAAGGFAVWKTLMRREPSPPIERFAAAIIVFTIATAAMTTVGRAQFGVLQAAQSRYASVSMVGWVALAVWVLSRFDRLGASLAPRRLAGAVTFLMAIGLIVQIVFGVLWVAKAENLRFAGLTLATRVDDDAWVATLHPETHHVYEVRSLLESAGRWELEDPRHASTLPAGSTPPCAGSMSAWPATPGPGLRLMGALNHDAGSALVTDRDSTVVGIVARAPVVDVPNPMQVDVAAAVWRRVRTGAPAIPSWAGFARTGSGPPYTVLAVDAADRPVCHLAVVPPAGHANR